MNPIDAILVHGIGKSLPASYYDGFVAGIREHLPLSADIVWHGVDYSPLLDRKEATILSWMRDMGWPKLRNFVCNYACDALAYGWPKRPAAEGDFIFDLTKLLMETATKARKGSKIVFIGHSLGSVVAFGASWDVKTDCLITLGSPFLYFSIRFKDFGEMNPNLPQFHNFWRSRDPVSTIISRSPKFRMVHDYEVKSWNPLDQLMLRSHSLYWRSNFVHSKIAAILKTL